MNTAESTLRDRVVELSPWRHDIDLGEFSTFEVGETVGPGAEYGHPEPRWQHIKTYLPSEPGAVVDLGCNAGGIAFRLERAGWEVTAVDVETEQAAFCAEVLESGIELVNADVAEWLPRTDAFDVVLALGLLYHIPEVAPSGLRDVEAEMRFVDACLETATDRVIIETDTRQWLSEYVEKAGSEVLVDDDGIGTPKGVRQVFVCRN